MKKEKIFRQAKSLKNISLSFIIGLTLATGITFAWNAVWHGTDWIKPGGVISAQKIGESLEFLFNHSVPQNFPECQGADKALQWDGEKIICGTITVVATTTELKSCGSYRSGETWVQKISSGCGGYGGILGYSCSGDSGVFRYYQCMDGKVNITAEVPFNNCECWDSCFTGESLVTMADGSQKPIKDIKPGDKVRSAFGGVNIVLGMQTPPLGKRALYAFNDSEDYFVTDDHPFLTTDGWKSISPEATLREEPSLYWRLNIKKLKVGDVLITSKGKMRITKIKPKWNNKPQTTYNLILDGDHTYIVNDFAVHNKM